MRTKTLVLSAAALAAGILSTMAQSNVFSVNVVGYINVALPANVNVLTANQLDNGTNDLNSLFSILPTKSQALLWNGTAFVGSSKGGTPSVWSPNLSVPPGTGVFITSAKTSVTNTYVGNVIVGPGGSTTNSLGTTLTLVGSAIPYGDDLNGTNILLSQLPSKSSILTWNGSAYVGSSKGGTPSLWSPDLQIAVGQGFFVQSKSATNWVQSLPAQ